MQKPFHLLAFLIAVSLLCPNAAFSQSNAKASKAKLQAIPLESPRFDEYFSNPANVPTLRGQLVGFEAGELDDLKIEYIFQVPSKLQQTKVAAIDRYGRFEMDLEFAFPLQEVMIKVGNFHFSSFMVRRDLTVELDLAELKKRRSKTLGKGVKFSGDDAEMAAYLYRFNEKTRMKMTALAMQRSAVSGVGNSPADGLERLDEIYQQEKEILNSYLKKNPSEFAWILKENLTTYHYENMLLFHLMSRGSTDSATFEKCAKHQPAIVNQNTTAFYHNISMATVRGSNQDWWFKILRDLNPAPSDQEDLEAYIQVVKKMHARETFDESSREDGEKRFVRPHQETFTTAMVAEHVKNIQNLLPTAKADVTLAWGASGSPVPVKFMSSALDIMSDGWCKTVLQEQYQKNLDRVDAVQRRIQRAMASGEESLGKKILTTGGMHLFQANHSSAEEFADALGKSFPGKAIVLDFWSMSCGACIHDMKNSKDTKAELADQPIVFVYACLDSKKQAWMEKVVDTEAAGHHVFLNETMSAQAMEYFKLDHFPTIIFIDQKGNYDQSSISFLSAINAEQIKKRLDTAALKD